MASIPDAGEVELRTTILGFSDNENESDRFRVVSFSSNGTPSVTFAMVDVADAGDSPFASFNFRFSSAFLPSAFSRSAFSSRSFFSRSLFFASSSLFLSRCVSMAWMRFSRIWKGEPNQHKQQSRSRQSARVERTKILMSVCKVLILRSVSVTSFFIWSKKYDTFPRPTEPHVPLLSIV